MWLVAVDLETLEALNAQHDDRKISVVAGSAGGWLVHADILNEAGEGGYWQDYGDWLRSLTPTDDVPAALSE